MNNGIKYAMTGLYLAIKHRRPNGTPYFNMRLFVTICLDLNLFSLCLLLEKIYKISIMPKEKISFVSSTVVLSIIIMIMLSKLIPETELKKYDMEKKEIKRINLLFFLYFFLSVFLLGYLLSQHFYPVTASVFVP